jgi:hypothetical protein
MTMQPRTWVYQKRAHVLKFGLEHAPYYVGWYDAKVRRRAKSCGAGPAAAGMLARQPVANKAAFVAGGERL